MIPIPAPRIIYRILRNLLLRPRLAGYASLILVMIGLFTYSVTHRVPFGLVIERERSRLYKVDWEGNVENVYTLRISNRGGEAREYAIEFEAPMALEYDGPERVRVAAGDLKAAPVRLQLLGGEGRVTEGFDVRFRVRPMDDERYVVEEETRFRVPEEGR